MPDPLLCRLTIALLALTFLGWMNIATVNPCTMALARGSAAFGIFAVAGVTRALSMTRSEP